jgi:hypothetical protein
VVIDAQGHLYVAGYEDGIIGKTNIEPAGDAKGVVFKYAPSGQLLSTIVIDTPGADSVEAMALDRQSGELLLAGRTDGALPGFSNRGQFDLFLGRLAPGAQPLLAQFGTERPEHPRRIEPAAGGAVVAGFYDIYVPTNYVETWEDPLLARFTLNGENINQEWRASMDTAEQDVISALAVAPSDGATLYVAGTRMGGPQAGMFLTAVDSQGTLIWERRLTPVAADSAAALAIAPDGNLLLAGSTFSDLGETSYGQQDAVVITVDSRTGETVRVFRYGSSEVDWVTDMAVDPLGNIYLVGETLGAVEPGGTNLGSSDIFLIKFDPEGELLSARQWGTETLDSPTAVAVDPCSNAFIVGYTDGPLLGAGHGSRDGFVIAVSDAER